MKLSSLLTRRQALLHNARLANLAFAYDRLSDFAWRIARARLTGTVRLQAAEPEAQRYLPALTAVGGSQAVIEEHFGDQDLFDFADVIGVAQGETVTDITFRLEDVYHRFVLPLCEQLKQAGVTMDRASKYEEEARHNPADYSRLDEED
jgi:hypothetical protein